MCSSHFFLQLISYMAKEEGHTKEDEHLRWAKQLGNDGKYLYAYPWLHSYKILKPKTLHLLVLSTHAEDPSCSHSSCSMASLCSLGLPVQESLKQHPA